MADGRDIWWHDIVDRQSEDCPPVPVDREHMLYLLYTSGTTAKPKGILHTTAGYLLGHVVHPRDDLRHQARRRVLVRRRHRLGDRPQLHRLRAARQRDDRRPVRGRAGHAGLGPLVADHRGLQGHDPVLRPDRHPGVHEAGRGAARRRTTCRRCASSARSASRSTPRRGSGTTSTSAATRRPIVDTWWQTETGHDHDHAAARRHDHEARLGDLPVPGHRRRRRRRRRQLGAARRWRLPRPEAALAGDAARHLRRPGALQARRTGAASRGCTSPATAPSATRTATSGCSAGSTTS